MFPLLFHYFIHQMISALQGEQHAASQNTARHCGFMEE